MSLVVNYSYADSETSNTIIWTCSTINLDFANIPTELKGRDNRYLLPAGSGKREVLGVGSIPVAILHSCQNMRIVTLQLHNMNIVG